MKHKLQQKMIDILARCMDMTIATTRSDGTPQATVVSFVHDGLVLYFGCGAGSQKAMNIARDPGVSVAMTAPYENWLEIKGLSMAATATEVVSPSELTQVGRMMVQRFPQISAIQPSEAAPVKLFRVRPTIISVLDYSLGFGHTDHVKVEGRRHRRSLGQHAAPLACGHFRHLMTVATNRPTSRPSDPGIEPDQ